MSNSRTAIKENVLPLSVYGAPATLIPGPYELPIDSIVRILWPVVEEMGLYVFFFPHRESLQAEEGTQNKDDPAGKVK